MAHVDVNNDTMTLVLTRTEIIFALHRSPQARVTDIVEITAYPNLWLAPEIHGFRAPGTGIPWVVALGTWRMRHSKNFCAVYKKNPGFVISFREGEFASWVFTAPEIPSELHRFLS